MPLPRNDSVTAVYNLRADARYAWLDGRNKRAEQLNKLADQMAARLRKHEEKKST